MIEKNSRIPLYVQVKEDILRMIAAEKYSDKFQLPTEREFMEKYGVGRATVRAALSDLEYDGVIVKRRGIGTFAAPTQRAGGFEPLISLTYFLDRMGINSSSTTVCSKPARPSGEMLAKWDEDMWVHYVKRIRRADGDPIAIEDSYFVSELYGIVKNVDASSSVAHAILSSNAQLDKIEQTILIREPAPEEAETLHMPADAKAVEMTRWIYRRGNPVPASFVKFVMAENLLEFPFAALGKR